jgi:hypothetical protein
MRAEQTCFARHYPVKPEMRAEQTCFARHYPVKPEMRAEISSIYIYIYIYICLLNIGIILNVSIKFSSSVRFEVFTVVTMKNYVFWDVTPCGSCKNRRFV